MIQSSLDTWLLSAKLWLHHLVERTRASWRSLLALVCTQPHFISQSSKCYSDWLTKLFFLLVPNNCPYIGWSSRGESLCDPHKWPCNCWEANEESGMGHLLLCEAMDVPLTWHSTSINFTLFTKRIKIDSWFRLKEEEHQTLRRGIVLNWHIYLSFALNPIYNVATP